MNYNESINKILEDNHDILIDTSSLMNTERMELFISEIENTLKEFNKKIIVLEPVLLELIKHSISTNSRKKYEADRALDLIRKRKDIFEVREEENKEEKPFADSALLSELIKNKRHYKQLLISNDEKMTRDAFNFNRFNSVMGGWITICFISPEGKMRRCHVTEDNNSIPKELVTEKSVVEYKTIEKVKVVKEKQSALKKYGGVVIGFVGGVAITIASRPLLRIVRASFC